MNEKANILIVDDQLNNLKIISELLSSEYNIYTSTSGAQTFKILEKILPDLILLDIMMPQMSGFQVCEKIKENPTTREIPVIFLTAKTSTEDILQGFSKGAADYIGKPVNPKEILARVKNHIQLKKAKDKIEEMNSQLETLNKEKDKFFSIISHDLKNPMGAISTLSKMLTKEIQEEGLKNIEESHVLKTLDLIGQGTDSTYNLLQNLLTWSRTQTGRIKINKRHFLFNDLLNNVIYFCQSLASNKNINIKMECEEKIRIYADLDMLRTALTNLITNAIKFTEIGGSVTIQASLGLDKIIVSVIDTGVGISQERIGKLFAIDEKVSTKGTGKEEGTGLGLLISKEFIDMHNGQLWVESKEDEGSKFSFSLPIGEK